jgi:hypothetical protein
MLQGEDAKDMAGGQVQSKTTECKNILESSVVLRLT